MKFFHPLWMDPCWLGCVRKFWQSDRYVISMVAAKAAPLCGCFFATGDKDLSNTCRINERSCFHALEITYVNNVVTWHRLFVVVHRIRTINLCCTSRFYTVFWPRSRSMIHHDEGFFSTCFTRDIFECWPITLLASLRINVTILRPCADEWNSCFNDAVSCFSARVVFKVTIRD